MVLFKRVTVATAGAAQQGPDQAVAPKNFVTVIADPRNTGTRAFLANSETEAETDGDDRTPIETGDGISVKIGNTKELWVDVDTDGDSVIFIVEE
jgi:hypothetical protein